MFFVSAHFRVTVWSLSSLLSFPSSTQGLMSLESASIPAHNLLLPSICSSTSVFITGAMLSHLPEVTDFLITLTEERVSCTGRPHSQRTEPHPKPGSANFQGMSPAPLALFNLPFISWSIPFADPPFNLLILFSVILALFSFYSQTSWKHSQFLNTFSVFTHFVISLNLLSASSPYLKNFLEGH